MKIKFPFGSYKVAFRKKIEFDTEDEDEALGAVDFKSKTIEIVKTSQMEEVILHEILHAILIEGGYVEIGKLEPLICYLTMCLVYTLKNNMDFTIKLLFNGEERYAKKALQTLKKRFSTTRRKKKKLQRDKEALNKNQQDVGP